MVARGAVVVAWLGVVLVSCVAAAPLIHAPLNLADLPKVTIEAHEIINPNPPYPYCHSGSITELKDGTMVGIFHAGSGEGQPDVEVHVTRRDRITGQWSVPVGLNLTPGYCDGNPSLFQNLNGSLFITFHSGGGPEDPTHCSTHSWNGWVTRSDDSGLTWYGTHKLGDGYMGGIKNPCITMSNGKVLCPASTEAVMHHLIGIWESHAETTDQDMTEWSMGNTIRFFEGCPGGHWCQGLIQPTFFEPEPGHIVALMRSGCGCLAMSESKNYGKSFDAWAHGTEIPNPNAGMCGVTMRGAPSSYGNILVFNDSPEHRTPLSLAVSGNALNFTKVMDLESGPDECTFQYPTVVQGRDPNVAHIIYTHACSQRTMAYMRIRFQAP